jgi:hypothetical protein
LHYQIRSLLYLCTNGAPDRTSKAARRPRRPLRVRAQVLIGGSAFQIFFLLLEIRYQLRVKIIFPFPHESNRLLRIVRRPREIPFGLVNGHEPLNAINTLGELPQKLHARFFGLIKPILVDKIDYGIGEVVKVGFFLHKAVDNRMSGRWGRDYRADHGDLIR